MAITKAAQEKAAKVIDTTKTKAAEIRKSANKYAEDVFEELEAYYKESIELIHENKSRLYGKIQPSNPVSYTHLDVYKRQYIDCWRRRPGNPAGQRIAGKYRPAGGI